MKELLKEKLISFLKTFVANFSTAFGAAFLLIPTEVFLTVEFWTGGGILVLIASAVRSAVDTAWKKTMPVSFGGVRKR